MTEQGTVVVACAVIVAVGQIAVTWISHRTHKAVNSTMTELLRVAEQKYKAEGVIQGKAEEKHDEQVRKLNPTLQDMGGD